MTLPPWLAAMVHVPLVTGVTVLPLMVQTARVLLVSVTAKLELAVAVQVLVPVVNMVNGVQARLMV